MDKIMVQHLFSWRVITWRRSGWWGRTIGLKPEWQTSCEVKVDWNNRCSKDWKRQISVCLNEDITNSTILYIKYDTGEVCESVSVSAFHTRRKMHYITLDLSLLHTISGKPTSKCILGSILIHCITNHQTLCHLNPSAYLNLFCFFNISGTFNESVDFWKCWLIFNAFMASVFIHI